MSIETLFCINGPFLQYSPGKISVLSFGSLMPCQIHDFQAVALNVQFSFQLYSREGVDAVKYVVAETIVANLYCTLIDGVLCHMRQFFVATDVPYQYKK